jgi:lysophospholipase L1-like esterase
MTKPVLTRQHAARLAIISTVIPLLFVIACSAASQSGVGPSPREGAVGSGGQPGGAGMPIVGTGGSSVSGQAGGVGGAPGGSVVASSGGASETGGTSTGGRTGTAGVGSGGTGAAAGGMGTIGAGGSSAGGGSAGGKGTAGRAGASGGGNPAGGGGGSGSAGTSYDPCPPAPTDCKIMPFGDSITDGYLAQRGGYRIPLFQRAHQEGKHLTFVGSAVNGPAMVDGVPFPQHHEGHSAYTIDDEPLPAPAHKGISPFVKTSIPAYHPDIVLLMIGTNDVDNSIDLPNVPTRLGALIDSIIALDAHTLIVVAQITPTMQDPLNARIQAYNAAIPAVVKARADAGKHVVLVDMYNAFVSDGSYRSTLMYDRLHPNIAGFQKMADTWNTVIHDLVN